MYTRNSFTGRKGIARRAGRIAVLLCVFTGLYANTAKCRGPQSKDQTELGPVVTLDLGRLKHFVKKDMAPDSVLARYPKTNGHLTFLEPVPYLMDGQLYPIDRVIQYTGARSQKVEGSQFSGVQTAERNRITFLFFREKLKIFVVRHEVRRGDSFVMTQHTTQNFLRFVEQGGNPGDFLPHGGCLWQLYRKLYMNMPPLLEGHCYWDKPGFSKQVMEDPNYQRRLKAGYESTVDVSRLP